jgi:hypothetical protein
MRVNRQQLNAALDRKVVFADIMLLNKACYLNGITRLQNFLLQKPPTADGLPFLSLPYSEEMVSLFSFMVQCRTDDFDCKPCFWRNECVKKVLLRIEKSVRRSNNKVIMIDVLLANDDEYKKTIETEAAIKLLKTIIYQLGEDRAKNGPALQ